MRCAPGAHHYHDLTVSVTEGLPNGLALRLVLNEGAIVDQGILAEEVAARFCGFFKERGVVCHSDTVDNVNSKLIIRQ